VIYAVDYDTNSSKSLLCVGLLILAMMPCVRADKLAVDQLCYVTSVKYLGVVLDATKYFGCLIDHIPSCFNSIFVSQRLLILKLLPLNYLNDIAFLLYYMNLRL